MSSLLPKTYRIFLEACEVSVDIGFHDFEIGQPQRLLVDIDVAVTGDAFAASDDVGQAWNYDVLRSEVRRLAATGRYNLQETFARAVFAFVAARPGVLALTVTTRKPDIYPDCRGVGVSLSSE